MCYFKRSVFSLAISFLLLSQSNAKPELEIDQKPEVSVNLTLVKGMSVYVCYEGDALWGGELPLMGYSYPKEAPIDNQCNIRVGLYVDKRGRLLVHCKQSLAGLEGKQRADVSMYYPVSIKGAYQVGKCFKATEKGRDMVYRCKILRGKETSYVKLYITDDLESLKKSSRISIYAVGWEWEFWDVSYYQRQMLKKKSK